MPNAHQSGESLEATAKLWPTPNALASQDGESPETWLKRREEMKTKGYNGNGAGMPLAISAQLWPTPTGGDAKASGHRQDERTPTSHEGTTLSDAIHKLWPTPRTITGGAESGERKQELGRTESGGGDLQAAAASWPTPNARDWKGQDLPGRTGAESLPDRLMHWPTPRTKAAGESDSPKGGRDLSRHVPTTPTAGAAISSERRTLNPRFVEALMGWPEGWSVASIGSACSATAWSLWWRHMRSALSRLGSTP